MNSDRWLSNGMTTVIRLQATFAECPAAAVVNQHHHIIHHSSGRFQLPDPIEQFCHR